MNARSSLQRAYDAPAVSNNDRPFLPNKPSPVNVPVAETPTPSQVVQQSVGMSPAQYTATMYGANIATASAMGAMVDGGRGAFVSGTTTAGAMIGSGIGGTVGGAIGTAILPGAGTVAGTILGNALGGTFGAVAANAVANGVLNGFGLNKQNSTNNTIPDGLLPQTTPEGIANSNKIEPGKFYDFGNTPVGVRFPTNATVLGVFTAYVFDFQITSYDFVNEQGFRNKGTTFQFTPAVLTNRGWMRGASSYGFVDPPADVRFPKGVNINGALELLPAPGQTQIPQPKSNTPQQKSTPKNWVPSGFVPSFPIPFAPLPSNNPAANPKATPQLQPTGDPTKSPSTSPGNAPNNAPASNINPNGRIAPNPAPNVSENPPTKSYTANPANGQGQLNPAKANEMQNKANPQPDVNPAPPNQQGDSDPLVPVTIPKFVTWNRLLGKPVYVNETIMTPSKMVPFVQVMGVRTAEIRSRFGLAELRAKLVQVMNILSTAATLHNAAMLSANAAQTVGEAVTNSVQTFAPMFGVDKEVAESFDLNEVLGKATNTTMENAIGKEAWGGTKETWLKLNRIITTASNIIWTVRSISDSAREVAEWTAENTGKIGNALKRFRVVGENAYSWMPEQVTAQNRWTRQIQRVTDGMERVENFAGSLSGAVSEVRSGKEEFEELKEQKQNFDKAIKEALPNNRPDNDPTKKAADESDQASKSPNLQVSDRQKGDTD